MPHHQEILNLIHGAIDNSPTRQIPFSEFMNLALYGSDDAYYRRPNRPVGRQGDFYTSVSVGKMFGIAIAEWIIARWKQMGMPHLYLIEQGTHDGTLMIDIFDHLAATVDDAKQFQGIIVEPFESARERQQTKVSQSSHAHCIHWINDLKELAGEPLTGIIYCNELLDAFPVERTVRKQNSWEQLTVGKGDSPDHPFAYSSRPIDDDSPLAQQIVKTTGLADGDFPEGYTTEINTGIESWIHDARSALSKGSVLAIDYGFAHEDFYHSTHADGTLRTYFQHQAIDDPLQHIGNSDITAHIDFTWLADCARAAGLSPRPLDDQGRFLVECTRSWLLENEQSGQAADAEILKLMRQFNTLTHPGSMGRKFKVQVMDVMV